MFFAVNVLFGVAG